MKRIKLFEQFIAEKEDNSDLHKIYLAINPDSGHRWWSYKDFAGDNFFIQVTLENYKDIDINPDVCKKSTSRTSDRRRYRKRRSRTYL